MNEFKTNPEYKERQKMLIEHFLSKSLLDAAFKEISPLKATIRITGKHVPFDKRKSLFARKINEGERWSSTPFVSAYFHITGNVPEGADIDNLYLHFDSGSEAILLSKEGLPLKGFSMGEYDLSKEREYATMKCMYPLKNLIEDNKVDLYIEATDDIYFRDKFPSAGIFKKASLVQKDIQASALLYEMEVLLNYILSCPSSSKYYDDVLNGLEEIRDLFMYDDEDKVSKAREITSSLLSLHSSSSFQIYALGHSHLDLAWLWTFEESKKKAIRTITNAIYLLERYPSFKYSISQPKQLEWIKEETPSLFEKVQEYEKEGRIELLGGEYVENDLNNAGEESLFRQMLYGQKFYLENFNHYAEIGFYPDDFGFPPALPTILRETNQHSFYTAKLRMNHQNIFPYSSFLWRGMDGKAVLTHLSQNPYGYNGFALPKELLDVENISSKKCNIKSALYLYGAGDGGGGVSEDMEERIPLMNSSLSLPKIKEATAHDFFNDLGFYATSLPTYKGELYLENHQGTFTSGSEIKRWNRLLEEKLKEVEIYLAENSITSFDDELNTIWKDFLLLEFHDLLSGTSIKEVFLDAISRYHSISERLDSLMLQASKKNYSTTFKPSYFLRNFSPNQMTHYEKKRNYLYVYSVPEFGESDSYSRYKGKKIKPLSEIRTKYFKISFNEDGSFKEIINLETNNDLLDGYGNKFRVFKEPGDPKYANWNILENYRKQKETYMSLVFSEAKQFGPVYEIKNRYKYNESVLEQTILIDDLSKEIRIHHSLDWKEDNSLLKCVFKIKNMPDEVLSDTQFGYQSHSTKNDTSLHKAQYELCSYKWVDFSSKNDGVSFFNNSKGGFYAKDGIFEYSLLKSNSFPMERLDQSHTEYDYAIYVHNGFDVSDIDSRANAFNSNVLYFKKKEEPKNTLHLSNKNIVISCVKNSYNKDGMIIRLYNRTNENQKATMPLPASFSKAILCSGLEDQIEPININELSFSPFEIKTILLYN